MSIVKDAVVWIGALVLACGWCELTWAVEPSVGHAEFRGPVYQRRANESSSLHSGRGHANSKHKGHFVPQSAPPVSSGWFQRPYPYHLDFYRMRYGGSYAPYFGNLYGPPQIVTAPPYYGPYYGGGFGGGFEQPPVGDGAPFHALPPQTGSSNENLASPAVGQDPAKPAH